MSEQLSIIISILAALLTGGFLMIFIESQQVAGSLVNQFHINMNPFFRSLNNYVKFISSFRPCLTFKVAEDSDYLKSLEEDVERIARLGEQSIIWGQDYPADYFTAKELDSICNTINDIWYCVDKKYDYIYRHLDFDSHLAEISDEYIRGYLETISPKYKGMKLTKNLLAKVSGDFFIDECQPIMHILSQYESWQRKDKEFKMLALATIVFTLLSMITVLFLNSYIPIWIFKVLCVVCCGFLIFELYKLIKLENLSKTIMR